MIKNKVNKKKKIIRKKIQNKKLNKLIVNITNRYIYVQILSKDEKYIICSSSTLNKNIKNILINKKIYFSNKYSAKILGEEISKKLFKIGIKKILFDRSGMKYHGKVKSLADSIRDFGIII